MTRNQEPTKTQWPPGISLEDLQKIFGKYLKREAKKRIQKAWLRSLRKSCPEASRARGVACPTCQRKEVYLVDPAGGLYWCSWESGGPDACGTRFWFLRANRADLMPDFDRIGKMLEEGF